MSTPRVLIVEDQPLLALALSDLLDRLGYLPLGPARTLDEAYQSLDSPHIDAVLLDRDLGGECSQPFADMLQRMKIPFAWATGSQLEPGDRSPCLKKPFSVTELRQMMGQLLHHPAPA